MTTWNSRIIIRNDESFRFIEDPDVSVTLARGEVAFQISTNGRVSGRIGVRADEAPFDECPEIFSGGSLLLPLTVQVPEGSGLDDGTLLRWDAATSRFVADTEPIAVAANTTGALTYTASGDAWSLNPTAFVPTDIDGGAFASSAVIAPSFVVEPEFEPL